MVSKNNKNLFEAEWLLNNADGNQKSLWEEGQYIPSAMMF